MVYGGCSIVIMVIGVLYWKPAHIYEATRQFEIVFLLDHRTVPIDLILRVLFTKTCMHARVQIVTLLDIGNTQAGQ